MSPLHIVQVISFYGWRKLDSSTIINALNSIAPGVMRACWAEEVPRKFHSTFCAKWRRYIYLFPLRGGKQNSDLTVQHRRLLP